MWNDTQAVLSGVRRPQSRFSLITTLAMFAEPTPSPSLPYQVEQLVHSRVGQPPNPTNAIGGLLRDQPEAAGATSALLATPPT